MKLKIRFLPFISFWLLACGHAPQFQNAQTDDNYLSLQNEPSQQTIDPNINSYIVFDLLGGMFRREGRPSHAISLASKSIQITHPPLPEEPTQEQATEVQTHAFISEPFQIDSSRHYVGFQGEGSLTLSLLGEGGAINDVRHFSGLTMRFSFHNYAFNNPCLGKVKLRGEIHCEVQGDFDQEAETFLGEAYCTNGPKENPRAVLYRIPQKDYAIELDAHLTIDGDPYRYKSYQHEGEISIDGEPLTIEDLISTGSDCSQGQ